MIYIICIIILLILIYRLHENIEHDSKPTSQIIINDLYNVYCQDFTHHVSKRAFGILVHKIFNVTVSRIKRKNKTIRVYNGIFLRSLCLDGDNENTLNSSVHSFSEECYLVYTGDLKGGERVGFEVNTKETLLVSLFGRQLSLSDLGLSENSSSADITSTLQAIHICRGRHIHVSNKQTTPWTTVDKPDVIYYGLVSKSCHGILLGPLAESCLNCKNHFNYVTKKPLIASPIPITQSDDVLSSITDELDLLVVSPERRIFLIESLKNEGIYPTRRRWSTRYSLIIIIECKANY